MVSARLLYCCNCQHEGHMLALDTVVAWMVRYLWLRDAMNRTMQYAPGSGRRSVSVIGQNMTHEERAMNEFKLLIDGKLVPGTASLDVIDPATEEVIAKAPRADRAQLDEAVAAAK